MKDHNCIEYESKSNLYSCARTIDSELVSVSFSIESNGDIDMLLSKADAKVIAGIILQAISED